MGLRIRNYGGSLRYPVFRGRFTKNQYVGGNCLKRGRGAWAVCRFKGDGGGGAGLGEKEGVF